MAEVGRCRPWLRGGRRDSPSSRLQMVMPGLMPPDGAAAADEDGEGESRASKHAGGSDKRVIDFLLHWTVRKTRRSGGLAGRKCEWRQIAPAHLEELNHFTIENRRAVRRVRGGMEFERVYFSTVAAGEVAHPTGLDEGEPGFFPCRALSAVAKTRRLHLKRGGIES